MCKLSVQTDPTNEDPTRVKQKTRILDYLKNLLEVLRARLAIAQVLTRNNITTEPDQYSFTQTFLGGEALRISDLNLKELRHKMVSNLILVVYHVVNYFGVKECLSK